MSPTQPSGPSDLTTSVVDVLDHQSVDSDNSQATTPAHTFTTDSKGSDTELSSPDPIRPVATNKDHETFVLEDDPFDSETSRILFEAVDKFQSFGTGKFKANPQLIVVGGQSVGKSSLLQSLTDVPFPVGMDCCTRFATRIVSSRTAPGTPNEVKVSIRPPDFDADYFNYIPNDSYKDYGWEGPSLESEKFKQIVDEVSANYMGINVGRGSDKKNFAVEVLKIEISGPSRSCFSILDLPGIISHGYNIHESEVNGLQDMIIKYMSQPEHIVICVADACNDLSNQHIFKLATRHVDSNRLIGVFTKCDRTDRVKSVVGIATGTDEGMEDYPRHEWFVVRNKTNKENGEPNSRIAQKEAKLFNEAPWNTIPANRRGSSTLRKHLGRLLCDKIRDEFPLLFETLTAKLSQAKLARSALGLPRDTFEKRRAHLVRIAKSYQKLTSDAVEQPWQLGDERCRMRTEIRNANEEFAEEMRKRGHLHEFEDHSMTEENYIRRLNDALFPATDNDGSDSHTQGKLALQQQGASNLEGQRLRPSNSTGQTFTSNTEPIFAMIREEVAICSSTQLPGMVHPDVVSRLYKLQTGKWHNLAEKHVSRVTEIIGSAANAILAGICHTSETADPVYGNICLLLGEDHESTKQRVLNTLRKYCEADQLKILQTSDPNFIRMHQLMRSLRMAIGIRKAQSQATLNRGLLSVEEIGRLICNEVHFSSTNNAVLGIHDTLKAYYQISLTAFIRHVTNNIVEDYILDSNSPLWSFSLDFIYGLPDFEVDRLGAENSKVAVEREKLSKEIEKLNSVLQIGRKAMAATGASV